MAAGIRMKHHRIHELIHLPLPMGEVFEFFYDVGNMQRITPCELDFHVLTPLPMEMKKGAIVDYRLRLCGVPFSWRSEITHWEPPHKFVDEEVFGPYKMWVHIHNFWPDGEGTVVEDEILYRLPLPPFGEIAYPLVWAELKRIMRYRRRRIRELLVGDGAGVSGRGGIS
jgi:ligand-binding SRPBCC domain-containing protein